MISPILLGGAEGFERAAARIEVAGRQLVRGVTTQDPDSNPAKAEPIRRVERVEPEQAIVEMQQAAKEAQANVQVMKVDNERFNTFIDMMIKQGYPLR